MSSAPRPSTTSRASQRSSQATYSRARVGPAVTLAAALTVAPPRPLAAALGNDALASISLGAMVAVSNGVEEGVGAPPPDSSASKPADSVKLVATLCRQAWSPLLALSSGPG